MRKADFYKIVDRALKSPAYYEGIRYDEEMVAVKARNSNTLFKSIEKMLDAKTLAIYENVKVVHIARKNQIFFYNVSSPDGMFNYIEGDMCSAGEEVLDIGKEYIAAKEKWLEKIKVYKAAKEAKAERENETMA